MIGVVWENPLFWGPDPSKNLMGTRLFGQNPLGGPKNDRRCMGLFWPKNPFFSIFKGFAPSVAQGSKNDRRCMGRKILVRRTVAESHST